MLYLRSVNEVELVDWEPRAGRWHGGKQRPAWRPRWPTSHALMGAAAHYDIYI